jgi:hypothetical protein
MMFLMILIQNLMVTIVILVYDVIEVERKVLVDACYSALTGFSLRTFYGEFDTDPL